jgi:hypothetical protein
LAGKSKIKNQESRINNFLMLPSSYQLPGAILLVVGGIVSCFFGYRWFRLVLGVTGFVLGAMMASSVFGTSNTMAMVVAAAVGGLVGALLMVAAYFIGVALVGAGLGATVAHAIASAGHREPHVLLVMGCAIVGAIAAMYLQRYFIIVGTAFGGAWTLIVGAMAAIGVRKAMEAAAGGNVWVLYPLDPAPGQGWVRIVWIVLGLVGTAVQLGWTAGEKGRVVRRKTKK